MADKKSDGLLAGALFSQVFMKSSAEKAAGVVEKIEDLERSGSNFTDQIEEAGRRSIEDAQKASDLAPSENLTPKENERFLQLKGQARGSVPYILEPNRLPTHLQDELDRLKKKASGKNN